MKIIFKFEIKAYLLLPCSITELKEAKGQNKSQDQHQDQD